MEQGRKFAVFQGMYTEFDEELRIAARQTKNFDQDGDNTLNLKEFRVLVRNMAENHKEQLSVPVMWEILVFAMVFEDPYHNRWIGKIFRRRSGISRQCRGKFSPTTKRPTQKNVGSLCSHCPIHVGVANTVASGEIETCQAIGELDDKESLFALFFHIDHSGEEREE